MIRSHLLSITVALIIMTLSVMSSSDFDKIPVFKFEDKIVHFAMYFGFMAVILFERRRSLTVGSTILLLALIPVFYGILMELMQLYFTDSRKADVWDAVFNSMGALTCALLWMRLKPFRKSAVR